MKTTSGMSDSRAHLAVKRLKTIVAYLNSEVPLDGPIDDIDIVEAIRWAEYVTGEDVTHLCPVYRAGGPGYGYICFLDTDAPRGKQVVARYRIGTRLDVHRLAEANIMTQSAREKLRTELWDEVRERRSYASAGLDQEVEYIDHIEQRLPDMSDFPTEILALADLRHIAREFVKEQLK